MQTSHPVSLNNTLPQYHFQAQTRPTPPLRSPRKSQQSPHNPQLLIRRLAAIRPGRLSTKRQWERAGASIEGDHQRPSRTARKPNRPQRSLRAQDRSRGAPTANKPQAPALALCHRKTCESNRGYAAFLQNAPVVRHTRGFTPGWYRGRDGRCRPPLPPNRTGGFPASGSPVGESPACGGTGAIGTG